MGITKSGRFAAITNYRDLKNFNKNAPTRGMLTCNYLTEESEPQDYFLSIKHNLNNYNGFNLLIGNQDRLFYISNIKKQFTEIEPGIHGLSNSFLDTPWEKVEKSKQRLNEMIKSEKINATNLMRLLSDTDYAQEKNLPDTGIGPELERVLSSVFIKSEKYGTRCSTVLLVDRYNNVYFSEKTYLPYENRFITNDYKLSIESR